MNELEYQLPVVNFDDPLWLQEAWNYEGAIDESPSDKESINDQALLPLQHHNLSFGFPDDAVHKVPQEKQAISETRRRSRTQRYTNQFHHGSSTYQ